jgi:hypothetical protein
MNRHRAAGMVKRVLASRPVFLRAQSSQTGLRTLLEKLGIGKGVAHLHACELKGLLWSWKNC